MTNPLPWDKFNQETLETRVIRHEGFRSMPYKDTLANWTIGFGHCITKDQIAKYPNGITWDDAEKLLEYDLNIIKQKVPKEFHWFSALNELRKDVIIEMCFQIGIEGVSKFSNMISAIQNGNWTKAAQEMLNSQWHQETPARCEELANLMKNGYIDNNITS